MFQLFVKNWKSHFYCFKDKFKSAIKSIERLLDSITVTIGYKINKKSMCSCLKIHKWTTFSTCLLNSCLNDLLKDSNLCFTISFDLLLRPMLCKCRVLKWQFKNLEPLRRDALNVKLQLVTLMLHFGLSQRNKVFFSFQNWFVIRHGI
jgi:hypothetical protein